MTIRDEQERAFWLAWRKGLATDPKRHLQGLLDDLNAIGRAQVPGDIIDIDKAGPMTDEETAEFVRQWKKNYEGGHPVVMEPSAPTDDQIAAWIDANPQAFDAWVRKQERINGIPSPLAAPARPATRRRTRKEGA